MKKLLTTLLALSMALALLAGCGSKNNAGNGNTAGNGSNTQTEQPEKPQEPEEPQEPEQVEAPDLNKFYEDFMASLGEGNAPAMMDLDEATMDAYYPGLKDLAAKQSVKKGAAITMVSYEFVLLELENEADVATAQKIMQERIDSQANGGAFYPAAAEAWANGKVLTNGNVVALIVAGEQQADAEAAFNALFA